MKQSLKIRALLTTEQIFETPSLDANIDFKIEKASKGKGCTLRNIEELHIQIAT
jgi:hypothetical protein